MVQSYSIILWRKPVGLSHEEAVSMTENTFKCLDEYNPDLLPRYLTAWSKKKAKLFDRSRESIESLFRKEQVRANWPETETGYICTMFSSMDDSRSLGASFLWGMKYASGKDSVILNFPVRFPDEYYEATSFKKLFCDLVECIRPHYAFVQNGQNNQISNRLWVEKPTFVHWMNYYSKELLPDVKIQKVRNCTEVQETENGSFVFLLAEPLDVLREDHLHKQRTVSKLMGLL